MRDAQRRIDANRLRPSRGWKTACALDASLPRGYDLVSRKALRDVSRRLTRFHLQGATTARERRMAERLGLLDALEHFGIIQRTRGGAR